LTKLAASTRGTPAAASFSQSSARTPGEVRRTGPKLGQHNDEVFEELLGISEEDLDGLRERGIV